MGPFTPPGCRRCAPVVTSPVPHPCDSPQTVGQGIVDAGGLWSDHWGALAGLWLLGLSWVLRSPRECVAYAVCV